MKNDPNFKELICTIHIKTLVKLYEMLWNCYVTAVCKVYTQKDKIRFQLSFVGY